MILLCMFFAFLVIACLICIKFSQPPKLNDTQIYNRKILESLIVNNSYTGTCELNDLNKFQIIKCSCDLLLLGGDYWQILHLRKSHCQFNELHSNLNDAEFEYGGANFQNWCNSLRNLAWIHGNHVRFNLEKEVRHKEFVKGEKIRFSGFYIKVNNYKPKEYFLEKA
jgi:hypothetical protein